MERENSLNHLRKISRRVTQDNIKEVDLLISELIGSPDEENIRKVNHTISGQLPREWSLAEDFSTPYVLIPQAPTIGMIGKHIPKKGKNVRVEISGTEEGIWQDTSVAAMKRKSLHLYLEWLYWEKQTPMVSSGHLAGLTM